MNRDEPPIPLRFPSTLRPSPWVPSLLYVWVLLTGLYYNSANLCTTPVLPTHIVIFVGIFLILLALEQFGRRPVASHSPMYMTIGLLVARMVLFEVVAGVDCSGFSRVLFPIVPFVAYLSFGKKAGYGLALFYIGILLVKLWLFVPDWYLNKVYISEVLMFLIGLVFAISMAGAAEEVDANRRQAEQLLGELAVSHQKLRAYAEQAVGLAAIEERNRLARDIHDSLGHYLTAITILLEKATAFRQRNPEEAELAVFDAKRLSREALQDVRQSVSALRRSGEVFSLSMALNDLTRTMNNGQLTIHMEMTGDEAGFPKPGLMALYRAAQEALTNIQKHARAKQVSVQVKFHDHEVSLTVTDDRRGFDPSLLDGLPPNRTDRFGLQGVRERLELIGGVMRVESCPNQGTHLLITIPRRYSESQPSTLAMKTGLAH